MKSASIKVVSDLLQSIMDKAGLSNACLMQSVIISLALTKLKITNQVIAGYLVFANSYAIRHVWVHVFPTEIVDLSKGQIGGSLASILAPTYVLKLPEGCDLLDKDADNEEQHKELEEMLDMVCTNVGSTRVVLDRHTVLVMCMFRQPLWIDIVNVMCK